MKINKIFKISGLLCMCLLGIVQSLLATTQIDQTLDVGAIDGAHAVNLSGAFTYTIPIKIPEGTMGMQPNLSLNYNSQSGNGNAGYGWNLSGISAISRVNGNIYNDGVIRPVELLGTDLYALDGNRLISKKRHIENGNFVRQDFCTEIENFSQIKCFFPENSNSTADNAAWFEVKTKDGKTIEYGNTSDSKLNTEDESTALIWYINKVTDRNGNFMTYHYSKFGRQVLLSSIEYTGNINFSPYSKVEFKYKDRLDKSNAYIADSKVESNKLLSSIEVITNYFSHYKSYKLIHTEDDPNNTENHFNYLTEFQEWSIKLKPNMTDEEKTNRLNSLTFEYGGNKANSVEELDFNNNSLFTGLGKPNSDTHKWVYIPGNFNGDGLQDFLGLKIEINGKNAIYKGVSIFVNDNKQNRSGFIEMDIGSKMVNEFYPMLHYLNGANSRWFKYLEKSTQPVEGTTIHTGDINGDNIDDIVIQHSDIANFKYFESVGVAEYKYDFNNDELKVRDRNIAQLVDADGDGRLELLVIDSEEDTNKLYLTSFDERIDIVKNNFAPGFESVPWKLHTKDYKGTGKTHLVVTDIPFEANDYLLSFNIDQTNQISFTKLNSSGNNTNTSLNSYWLHANRKDFNGDGKEDNVVVLFDKNIVRVNINNTILETNVPLPYSHQELITADFNGDSYTDFLMIRKGTPDEADFYINKGKGTDYQKIEHQFPNGSYFNNDNGFDAGEKNLFQLTDIDGDGINEVFLKRSDLGAPKVFRLNYNNENRLLNKIINSYANETKVHYTTLSDEMNYTASSNLTYPLRTINGPLYVVSKVEVPTNRLFGEIEYSYENLITHLQGKGLLGFLKVTETDRLNNVVTESDFELDIDSILLLPYKTTKRLNNPLNNINKLSESISTYELADRSITDFKDRGKWPRLTETETTDYINKSKTITKHNYKNYGDTNGGNPSKTTSTVYDTSSDSDVVKYTTITDIEYEDCDWWITYLPKSVTTTLNRAGYSETNNDVTSDSNSRKVEYGYNLSNGNLKTETTDVGTDNEIVTTYSGYNVLGKPTSTKLVATKEATTPVRSTRVVYDNTYRYAIEEYNSNDNMVMKSTINQTWGLPETVTDYIGNVNGNKTSYTYDNYGRIKTTTDYLGQVATINRNWLNNDKDINDVKGSGHDIEATIYKVASTKPNAPASIAFYDNFGREVLSKTTIFGGSNIYTYKNFDDRGRVKLESGSFEIGINKEKPVITNYTYDDLNRVTKSNLSKIITNGVEIFNIINYSYPVRMVEVSGSGIIDKTTTYDVTGKVITAEDPGGQLNYSYNNFNELYQVKDQNGNVLTENEYDDFGRQTALVDINAGTTTYTYNAFDDLISQTDAKNNTTTITYDKLGRIATKKLVDANNAEINYSYTYNSATDNGALMLNEETGPNGYTSSFTYDNYGRQTSYTDKVDNKSFTTSQTYNAFGDIAAITYPGDFTVDYEYDSNTGAFYKATADDKLLYEMEAVNHLGQITNYKYNNGSIPVEHTFNKLGMPKTVKANNGNLFSWEYDFNITNGNLKSRKDVLNNQNETFGYDNLHRLTYVNNNEIVKYSYDGNINYKQDAGDYTYNQPNGKINAVTGISNTTNAIPLLTETIAYTAFDRPKSINEGNKSYELFYGADHNRRKTVYKENGATTTRYYSGAYEFIDGGGCGTSKSIYHLSFANSVDIIYYKETPPPPNCREAGNVEAVSEFYYVFTDYLGSILKVVDEAGNTKEEQSFDAWGRKRNPTNWQVYDQPKDALPKNLSWLTRGYTGHEHLYAFGIINMNNRLYDPIVGRMLAVDNFVADSESTQAFNRYSYAMNNPLKYTDPSGEFAHLIVGAVIGGLFNWATNGAQFNMQGLGYFAVGAAVGALTAGTGNIGSLGFISGAGVGSLTGLVGGISTGFGNSLVSGGSLDDALSSGAKAGVTGAIIGGITGGIKGGIRASNRGLDFWKGDIVKNPEKLEAWFVDVGMDFTDNATASLDGGFEKGTSLNNFKANLASDNAFSEYMNALRKGIIWMDSGVAPSMDDLFDYTTLDKLSNFGWQSNNLHFAGAMFQLEVPLGKGGTSIISFPKSYETFRYKNVGVIGRRGHFKNNIVNGRSTMIENSISVNFDRNPISYISFSNRSSYDYYYNWINKP